MAFLRFTRDHRGYENTFLMHASHPGERPSVLYWYRSAPGVRVGRPALDEDAIRTIEEQHPDVDFDWPQILEVGAVTEPEVERRPVRQRRRPAAPVPPPALRSEAAPVDEVPAPPPEAEIADVAPVDQTTEPSDDVNGEMEELTVVSRPHDLLEELVGHEIATRLHARYSEIITRVHHIPEGPQRAAYEARAESLNPDNWVTPDEVLRGVQHADALFDSLRRELLAH